MEVNIVNLVPTGLGFLPSGGDFCKIAQKILRPAPRLLYCFSRPFLASASPPFSNCYLVIEFCPTVCNPMDCSVPGFPVHLHSRSLLKLMSIESVIPSNHLVLCRPLLLLPSVFPSIRVFFDVSVLCITWPKYWSFSFSINPFNDYSGLISFRMDWWDLLAVQGTLKSLLQHHSSKA